MLPGLTVTSAAATVFDAEKSGRRLQFFAGLTRSLNRPPADLAWVCGQIPVSFGLFQLAGFVLVIRIVCAGGLGRR